MDDIDPLDSDEFDAVTPAQGGSPATGSPLGVVDGMGSAVEDALGALDIDAIVAQAANAVVTKHVTNLAKEALSDARTPERVALLQERAATAVERAFEPPAVAEDEEIDVDAEAETETETVYGSVDEWLRKYWRFTYRRRVSAKGTGTGRWKAEWWNTDEAVQRLETLWRGWEAARLDPGLGTSAWWINHAAPHMTALLAVDGPFADSKDENQVGEPLPYQRPPDHLFPPDRQP